MNITANIIVTDCLYGKKYEANFKNDAPSSVDEFTASLLLKLNHDLPADQPDLNNKDLIRSISKKYFGAFASDDWDKVRFSFEGNFRCTFDVSITVTETIK